MKLIALFNFYDEPIELFVEALASLPTAGVDHVVAVDGAYALFPDGQPASHPNQHAAIHLACRELGMSCTMHAPSGLWEGGEVEKRSFLFALGWACARDGDWFIVHDADMVVKCCPADLKERLAATEHEAAEVEVLDVVAQRAKQLDWPERFEFRGLYRAQRITVGPSHCIYSTADGRHLWGETVRQSTEPCLDLTRDVLVEHRPDERPVARQLAKLQYYAQRDEARVERGSCKSCDRLAVRLVPMRWRMTGIGPAAEWVEACETCAERLERVSRRQLCQLGVDPDSVVVENRNGRAPAGMAAAP